MFPLISVLLVINALHIHAAILDFRRLHKSTPCPTHNKTAPPWIDHFDWRECGGVSPVKDQGKCGDCWAFSAVANIESQYWIRRKPYILSEQFLLDCNTMGADCGDDGASSVVSTFADIITKLGGVVQDKDYRKYDGIKMQCPWDEHHPPPRQVNVAGMQRLQPGDEEGMARALREHGPLSAGINDIMMANATRDPLAIDEPTREQCPPEKRNHAVLIVGYSYYLNPDGSKLPYWIIKNSWGVTGWSGDKGYYYLRRGTNACGIAMDVSYATVL